VIAVGALASRLLADVDNAEVTQALAGAGLWFNIGAVSMQVRGNAKTLAAPLQTVYGHFPFVTNADWADVHLSIDLAAGLRRWIRPQVLLHADGRVPFDPFPASNALPLFEWGCNWMIGRCCNELLLLHSGALERDGLALLLPATPGSGKSTLTAALSQRGWRLLSDEFGAYDPTADVFRAVLKPIALKNESIAVIRQFAPSATLGPEFPNTRKGTVAHLAAGPDAVARRHETARPGAVVLPKWQAGSPTRWEPLSEQALFPALAFNAFNYSLLGAVGFQAVVQLVRRCPAWQLTYSDLDDALATLEAAWPAVLSHHRVAQT
jgi:HprK-related kinase A